METGAEILPKRATKRNPRKLPRNFHAQEQKTDMLSGKGKWQSDLIAKSGRMEQTSFLPLM